MAENNGKKKKFRISDLAHAVLTSSACAGFFLLIIGISAFVGSIKFQMENAFWFILFVFIFSVAAGTFTYMGRVSKRNEDAETVAKMAENLVKGKCDITLPDDLDGGYKKVAVSLIKLAEHLKKAEMSNNDFINDFSHELKTPIVSIRGFAKILSKGNLSPEEQKEYLDVIMTESDRLIDLTAGTLLLDRLDNDRLDVQSKLYNLSEQIRRQILMLQEQWEAKNIDLEADFTEYFVVSNEELVSQLFLNVIQNAVKFSHDGGKIKITITENDKNTTVCVSDNGIGMDEDTKKRMFDKYFRGDKSRSTPGNGLGLATVKKIAEVTGITLKVDTAENKGTDFYVIFKK